MPRFESALLELESLEATRRVEQVSERVERRDTCSTRRGMRPKPHLAEDEPVQRAVRAQPVAESRDHLGADRRLAVANLECTRLKCETWEKWVATYGRNGCVGGKKILKNKNKR